MKTKILMTPIRSVACTVLIVFLLTSCNKDIINDYGYGADDFIEIGSTQIGSDGGTLSGGSVEIVVPPGAFDQIYEITLLVNEKDTVFGNNALTSTYRITGLPNQSRG